MRTKAIFSPVGPRSILNTVPDAGRGAVAIEGGQQRRDRVQEVVDADAGQRGAALANSPRARRTSWATSARSSGVAAGRSKLVSATPKRSRSSAGR